MSFYRSWWVRSFVRASPVFVFIFLCIVQLNLKKNRSSENIDDIKNNEILSPLHSTKHIRYAYYLYNIWFQRLITVVK